MAIWPLHHVLQTNEKVAKDTAFHAGMVLARGTDGFVVKADRAVAAHNANGGAAIVGFSADQKGRVGATNIQPDPVGSTYWDGTNIVENNNGLYPAPFRQLADFVDDSVTNVSDSTSGASGSQGPRRGIGVYSSKGSKFVTDMWKKRGTDAATTDAAGAVTPAVNDVLTYGSSTVTSDAAQNNAGYLVKRTSAGDGVAVARVDEVNGDLLTITQLI